VFDLLVRHREALGLSRGPAGLTGGSSPTERLAMSSTLAGPEPHHCNGPFDDEDALRPHLLTLLGPLDVAGGGMGDVVLAWHQDLREVVLKSANDPHLAARFDLEVSMHGRLEGHPNIVVARTSFLSGRTKILMIGYVPGPNLKRHIAAEGPLPWRVATGYIRQAALGLKHAHDRGIIHRDVKSKNLVLDRDRDAVVVIDWGLALDLDPAHRGRPGETQAGVALGTPQYCAPEQWKDARSATAASDFYGLGCTWYELLTGDYPFRVSRDDQADAHAHTPVPRLPSSLEIPTEVEAIVRRLLKKAPWERYASAGDLISEIDELLGKPDTALSRRRHSAREIHALVGRRTVLTTAAALAVAGLAWRFGPWGNPPAGPLAFVKLEVDLCDVSAQPMRSGLMGETSFEARQNDQVTVFAELSRPAYTYLFSCRPDGALEVWSPSDESSRPGRGTTVQFPHETLSSVIGLDHGEGLQVFVSVASRNPLPPFSVWRKAHGPIPWQASVPADPGVVWLYDGERLEPRKAGGKNGTRGDPVASRGAYKALAALIDWLKERSEVDAISLLAFPVRPDPR
jgi:serine/threonine protein kinase